MSHWKNKEKSLIELTICYPQTDPSVLAYCYDLWVKSENLTGKKKKGFMRLLEAIKDRPKVALEDIIKESAEGAQKAEGQFEANAE